MTNSTQCNWEPFPSPTQVFPVISKAALNALLSLNYKNCPSVPPWYHYITAGDVIIVLILTPLLIFIKRHVTACILQQLGEMFDNSDSGLSRASETIHELLTRGIVLSWTLYEIFVSPNCSFMIAPSHVLIENERMDIPNSDMWLSRQMLMLLTVSRYAAAFIDVFVAEKRRDIIFLLIHHVVAVPLLTLAYRTMPDAGLSVLFLHEVCDISLELAKITHYLQTSKTAVTSRIISLVSEVAFFVFFVKWFIFRMYLFPVRGLYPVALRMNRSPCHSGTYAMAILLNSLIYILNTIWSLMIIRGLVNRLVLKRFTDETMDTPRENENSTVTKEQKDK